MRTYVNIGPSRSGTTSLYNILKQYSEVDISEEKEPLLNGYSFKRLNEYLSNWSFDCNKSIMLDASPNMVRDEDNVKNYLEGIVDDFKYICIIRNPKKYIITKIYITFLYEQYEKTNNLLDFYSMEKYVFTYDDFISKLDKDHSYFHKVIKKYSYLNWLNKVREHFDKKEILITSIDSENFIQSIEIFLKLQPTNDIEKYHLNKIFNHLLKIKILKIYVYITNYVNNCPIINDILKNEFKIIDKEYDTSLSEQYKDVLF